MADAERSSARTIASWGALKKVMAGCRVASMRAYPGLVWGRSAWAEFGLHTRNELMR